MQHSHKLSLWCVANNSSSSSSQTLTYPLPLHTQTYTDTHRHTHTHTLSLAHNSMRPAPIAVLGLLTVHNIRTDPLQNNMQGSSQ